MNKYALELKGETDWRLEKDFSSLSGAVRYAKNRFALCKYRIMNRSSGEIERFSDGDPQVPLELGLSQDVENDLALEMARFANTDRWRRRFQDRQVERQAEWNNARERERRLSRFNFVGDRPQFARQPEDTLDALMRLAGIKEKKEKVDWLKEGF